LLEHKVEKVEKEFTVDDEVKKLGTGKNMVG